MSSPHWILPLVVSGVASAILLLLATRWRHKKNTELEEHKHQNALEQKRREFRARLADLYADLGIAEDAMWGFITRDVYRLTSSTEPPSEDERRRIQRVSDELFREICAIAKRIQLVDPCDDRVKQMSAVICALDVALCRIRGLKPTSSWDGGDSFRRLVKIKRLGRNWTAQRNDLSIRLRNDFVDGRRVDPMN